MPPSMIPTPQSESIEAIGYDRPLRDLWVTFAQSSETYIYYPVPETVWDALLAADSKGTFVNMVLKPGYAVRRP
jgi:hypothetical protein